MTENNYYTLLSLPPQFDVDQAALEKAYFALQREYHPDRAAGKGEAERQQHIQMSMQINDAYQTLKSPLTRARYLLQREGVRVCSEQDTVRPDMALLEEIMELREALAEAEGVEEVKNLATDMQRRREECLQHMADAFKSKAMPGAAQLTLRLGYLQKMEDEIRQKRLMK